jgi:hypothetical protein
MLGIDFHIGFGIGMVISACVTVFYHFAENHIRSVFYKLKHSPED